VGPDTAVILASPESRMIPAAAAAIFVVRACVRAWCSKRKFQTCA
jgi:hypothetical protein